MSVLTYNGINLPYSHSEKYEQSAVRDEVGDVDRYLTKIDITVQCIINKSFLAYAAPLFAGYQPANAADLMNMVRDFLLQPRKSISFSVNGVEMIPGRTANNPPSTTFPGTVDSNNGPKPEYCNIMSLGEETFILTYRVVTWWVENNTVSTTSPNVRNLPTSNVVYNRWTESVDIDDCLFTRRTREGAFKIRSDVSDAKQADEFRYAFAAVGVPRGFLRESSRYGISPDGLTLQYRVVDKEYFKVPPQPAFKADGEFTMSFTGMGAVRHGDVRVRLEGGNYSNQGALFEKAWAIASKKILINGASLIPGNNKNAMMETASIRVGLYSNWVEVSIRALLTYDKGLLTKQGGKVLWVGPDDKQSFVTALTYTPFSDPQILPPDQQGPPAPPDSPPNYTARGSAWWLLQAAAYFDKALAQGLAPNDPSVYPTVTNPVIPQGATDGPQQSIPGVLIGRAGVFGET